MTKLLVTLAQLSVNPSSLPSLYRSLKWNEDSHTTDNNTIDWRRHNYGFTVITCWVWYIPIMKSDASDTWNSSFAVFVTNCPNSSTCSHTFSIRELLLQECDIHRLLLSFYSIPRWRLIMMISFSSGGLWWRLYCCCSLLLWWQCLRWNWWNYKQLQGLR